MKTLVFDRRPGRDEADSIRIRLAAISSFRGKIEKCQLGVVGLIKG